MFSIRIVTIGIGKNTASHVMLAAPGLPESSVDREPSPYYTNDRSELIQFLEREHVSLTGRVLEVGCAAGMAGPHLRRLGATELEGIEPHKPAAIVARSSGCYDTVHNCSWEEWVERFMLTTQVYDTIIFADVLEHMPDPAPVLRFTHGLLSQPSGQLVLSLPNIRHLSVIFGLIIHGDWKYQPSGILDQTHLRFFTTKSARRLLTETGYSTVSLHRWGALRTSRAAARIWPVLGEFVLSQFFIVAAPNDVPIETS